MFPDRLFFYKQLELIYQNMLFHGIPFSGLEQLTEHPNFSPTQCPLNPFSHGTDLHPHQSPTARRISSAAHSNWNCPSAVSTRISRLAPIDGYRACDEIVECAAFSVQHHHGDFAHAPEILQSANDQEECRRMQRDLALASGPA